MAVDEHVRRAEAAGRRRRRRRPPPARRRPRCGRCWRCSPTSCAIAARSSAALVALLVAAARHAGVPLAVRRMIDFGFSAERIGLIDQYFAVMIAVAAVLALASALRYYLVTIARRARRRRPARGGVRAI